MRKTCFAALLVCINLLAVAQERITEDNITTMPTVAGQVLSPKADKIVYTLNKINPETKTPASQLILHDLTSGKKEAIATQASDAKWSPDGSRIAFRTAIGKVAGIYVLDLNAPSTPKLVAQVVNSNHFLGHSANKNYAWSPDGKSIAYISADTTTGNRNPDPNSPKVIDRILYKSRTWYSDNMLTRLYVADVATGTSKMLTNDKFDSHSLTWSPDSRRIAFISNHTADPDNNYNNDIFVVDVAGGQVQQITNTPGTEHNPEWSPNGKYIIYPATVRLRNTKDSPPEDMKLYLYELGTGKVKCLTTELDERLSGATWASDSKTFYFGFPKNGKRVIYKGSIDNNTITPVIDKEASVGGMSLQGNKLAFTMSNVSTPNEIYITSNNGKTITQLTNEASSWIKDKTLSKTESFWFPSFDGVMVQGFIAYPANASAGTKLPVIHRIHGGPHGAFGYSFTDMNEILTGKGYAVISINPRGSSGYGQKFSDGTYQAWGGGDFQDLMKGMDYALEKYTFLDKDRLGVTGGSYGGFMTNWVVTQTNRYKAAVTSASVSNLISFYGTSIYPDLLETEFGGMPWDNYALLWHFSPMAHIKNAKTPTLIIHGENDMDVPITQAEEFFIGLKKLGVPAKFIRYPNEGHGFTQPKNRLHNTKQLLTWFDQYLQ